AFLSWYVFQLIAGRRGRSRRSVRAPPFRGLAEALDAAPFLRDTLRPSSPMSESAEQTPIPGKLPPPPPPEARRVTLPLPSEDDVAWVAGLRRAGVASELDEHELQRAVGGVPQSARGAARRAALLTTYYAAAGDSAKAETRRRRDRFFCHFEDE